MLQLDANNLRCHARPLRKLITSNVCCAVHPTSSRRHAAPGTIQMYAYPDGAQPVSAPRPMRSRPRRGPAWHGPPRTRNCTGWTAAGRPEAARRAYYAGQPGSRPRSCASSRPAPVATVQGAPRAARRALRGHSARPPRCARHGRAGVAGRAALAVLTKRHAGRSRPCCRRRVANATRGGDQNPLAVGRGSQASALFPSHLMRFNPSRLARAAKHCSASPPSTALGSQACRDRATEVVSGAGNEVRCIAKRPEYLHNYHFFTVVPRPLVCCDVKRLKTR
jgi:hypothetical protein